MRERTKDFMFVEDQVVRSVILVDTTRSFLSDHVVQTFVRDDRSTFDLVMIESFFQECTVALGHKYGAPVISIVPEAPWTTVSRWAANPSDFSYVKDFMLDAGKSLDFWDRLTNAYTGLLGTYDGPFGYTPKMEEMMDTLFRYPGYDNRPKMADMLENISLSLIDSDMMIFSPRPYVPSFVEVPGIHIRPSKKMDEVPKILDNYNFLIE